MIRVLLRIFAICASLVVLICCIGGAWFFLYSGDLPDIGSLRLYAPHDETYVLDPCSHAQSVAIPYNAFGYNVLAALNSAEGNVRNGHAGLSVQVARTVFCEPSRMLERHIQEARLAAQVKLRFARETLVTIHANRAWFGDNQVGVKAAAKYYFDKEPNQLDIGEAALLAGLIKAPFIYSPYKHPDRALKRRNEVIDAMVSDGAITAQQGESAKATTISLAIRAPNK
jgi:penicillin-binding protein 1A